MVAVGLAEPAVTNTPPSTMYRLGTSWARHQRSTTDELESSPIRVVPSMCEMPVGQMGLTLVSTAPAASAASTARAALKSSILRLFSDTRYSVRTAGSPSLSSLPGPG